MHLLKNIHWPQNFIESKNKRHFTILQCLQTRWKFVKSDSENGFLTMAFSEDAQWFFSKIKHWEKRVIPQFFYTHSCVTIHCTCANAHYTCVRTYITHVRTYGRNSCFACFMKCCSCFQHLFPIKSHFRGSERFAVFQIFDNGFQINFTPFH